MTFLLRNWSLHCILSQVFFVPKKRERAQARLFWRCGTTLSFLPHFYYICLIRAMSMCLSFFSKAKNWKVKFRGALENAFMIQIMARPFFKTSGCRWTVNFWLNELVSPVFGGPFFNARYVHLSWRFIKLAVHSEDYDILSFCSHFQSKGGIFFWDTRYILCEEKAANAVTLVSSASINVGILESSLLIVVLMVVISTSLCVRLQVNAFLDGKRLELPKQKLLESDLVWEFVKKFPISFF